MEDKYIEGRERLPERIPLVNRIDMLESNIKELLEKKKKKKFFMPFKGRVGKSKLNKGYVSLEVIDENKNVHFTKAPIVDGIIKTNDGTYHAIEEFDIFFYKGKPFVHQPIGKINPWNPLRSGNETYGQKYIMAKMKSDLIKAMKKGISMGIIFFVIVIGIVAYYFYSKGGFGGAVGG